MGNRPLCFVLMPFGVKPDPTGLPPIDFDRIYETGIRPGIEDAGLEPIRADHEVSGGIIHRPMYERLLLCEYAVADLTTANGNVLYELGIRHATRPYTTLPIFAKHQPILFDVSFVRGLGYETGPDNAFGAGQAGALRAALASRLRELKEHAARHAAPDSPLFQLLKDELDPPDLKRLKTDVFREHLESANALKARLAAARATPGDAGLEAVRAVEKQLGKVDERAAGVQVDLFLSYRAVKGYEEMVALFDRLHASVKRTTLAREQLAFALNRLAGRVADPARKRSLRERAIQVLNELIEERGGSSESLGILGRVYKDLWAEARDAGRGAEGDGWLDRAIDAYRRGFKADWRDAFPGVNACTLLDIRGDPASLEERDRLLAVVRFSCEQRLAGRAADYWDHATMLELAVLASDRAGADRCLGPALAAVRERWEPETTARNLELVARARKDRGVDAAWIDSAAAQLREKAAALSS